MSELRPIIFSAPMVKAILAGVKTQTRRLKNGPCRYGGRGDRLWVKETLVGGKMSLLTYAADDTLVERPIQTNHGWHYNWKRDYGQCVPSIYMPRWASRIMLEIVAMRDERLQELTDDDATAEGVTDREAFARLWDDINGKRAPWANNPVVWVVSFRRVEVDDAAITESAEES